MDSSKKSPAPSKDEQTANLKVGDLIWAGLDTFYSGDLRFSDFPMSPNQLSLNMVEGTIAKKLKRSYEAIFQQCLRKETAYVIKI